MAKAKIATPVVSTQPAPKKGKKSAAPAPVAPAAPAPVAGAKLTRRNTTPSTAVLYLGKLPKSRAAHNSAAWQAISAALPATAAALAALPVFSQPQYSAALVSGPAHVSYLQRRGILTTVKPQ